MFKAIVEVFPQEPNPPIKPGMTLAKAIKLEIKCNKKTRDYYNKLRAEIGGRE